MEEKLIKVTYGAFTYKKTLMKLLNIYYFRQIILMIFFVFVFGEFEGPPFFFRFFGCEDLRCFLTIFLILKVILIIEQSRLRDVIYGRSLLGSSARGPPVFQVLSPYQISSQYLLAFSGSGSDTIKNGWNFLFNQSKFSISNRHNFDRA
jgi:hypothetical protein